MKFEAKSQKELDEDRIVPEGEYGFVISNAVDKVSKIKVDPATGKETGGNEMIEATLRVYKPDGKFILVNDYLMASMMYKLLHLCEAVGLSDKYNAGELTSNDLIGKEGYVKIVVQKGVGTYSDRNAVKDYVVPKAGEAKTFKAPQDNLSKALDGDEMEDDIPF